MNLKEIILNEIRKENLERIGEYLRSHQNPEEYPFNNIFGDSWRVIFPLKEKDNSDLDDGAKIIEVLRERGWIIQAFPYATKIKYKIEGGKEEERFEKRVDLKAYKSKEKDGKKVERTLRLGKAIALEFGNESPETKFWNQKSSYYTKDRNYEDLLYPTKYSILLSRHPIDVLRMSNFPGISSCHSEGHSYFHCAIQEAQGYGPIAFLIKSEDIPEIENKIQTSEIFKDDVRDIEGIVPLTRLRVRYLKNERDDVSLAVPEIRRYGNDIPGFYQALKNFLLDKQEHEIENINSHANWKILGGSYSDHDAHELLNQFINTSKFTEDDLDARLEAQNQRAEELQHVFARGEIEDDEEPFIYFNGSITFEFEDQIRDFPSWNDRKEQRRLLDALNEINWDISVDNIEIEDKLIMFDISTQGYESTIEGYDEFLDDCEQLDRHYDNFKEIVRKILIIFGYIKNKVNSFVNLYRILSNNEDVLKLHNFTFLNGSSKNIEFQLIYKHNSIKEIVHLILQNLKEEVFEEVFYKSDDIERQTSFLFESKKLNYEQFIKFLYEIFYITFDKANLILKITIDEDEGGISIKDVVRAIKTIDNKISSYIKLLLFHIERGTTKLNQFIEKYKKILEQEPTIAKQLMPLIIYLVVNNEIPAQFINFLNFIIKNKFNVDIYFEGITDGSWGNVVNTNSGSYLRKSLFALYLIFVNNGEERAMRAMESKDSLYELKNIIKNELQSILR